MLEHKWESLKIWTHDMTYEPHIPFWHLYELKNCEIPAETKQTAKTMKQEIRASYEVRMSWTYELIIHQQTLGQEHFNQGVCHLPSPNQSIPCLSARSPLSQSNSKNPGSFEPLTWGLYYIKEPVNRLKASVCINWHHLNHHRKQYSFSCSHEPFVQIFGLWRIQFLQHGHKLW